MSLHSSPAGLLGALLCLALNACGDDDLPTRRVDADGGTSDAGASDASIGGDGSAGVDADVRVDASTGTDAGTDDDAAVGVDAGSSAVTAAALLARTATCVPIAGAPLYALDSGDASTVQLCERDGAVWFRADLDVDCDGGRAASCMADPDYLPDTAFNTSAGESIDSNTIPFVVLPGVRAGFDYRTFGIRGGQSVAVVYAGRVFYGVLGDIGPTAIIGEASYAMAEALGVSPDPRTGGIDPADVTYIFFTGTANRVAPLESIPEAERIGEAAARAFLATAP